MRALFGKEYEMTIEEAVCYLKKQDLAALEVGTYQVNDDFYFMIQEYETKPAENCRLETHNRYADIQWIISGEEEIDTVSRTGCCILEGARRNVSVHSDNWFLCSTSSEHCS